MQGAVRAFHRALDRRPHRFRTLIDLATAHLRANDDPGAQRALSRARDADPARFDARAARLLARWGFELEAVGRAPPQPRPQPVPQGVVVRRRSVTAQSLPFGDCCNLDEYARFRAMPPITRAEIESLDWDRVIDDLLEE